MPKGESRRLRNRYAWIRLALTIAEGTMFQPQFAVICTPDSYSGGMVPMSNSSAV